MLSKQCPYGHEFFSRFHWCQSVNKHFLKVFLGCDALQEIHTCSPYQLISVQLLSCAWLLATPWTAACQASLSITSSWSLPNSCPLSRWCHPTIASSVAPFSSHLQSCLGSISSFFLKLFLHWSLIVYWAPTNLGNSSFNVLSFCLFILLMGFSRQEYWSYLPFPSPVDHILSELSTMTRPFLVALHSMAHSFIELDKAVVQVIRLVSFLWWCFQSVYPLIPSLLAFHLTGVSLTLDMGCLLTASTADLKRGQERRTWSGPVGCLLLQHRATVTCHFSSAQPPIEAHSLSHVNSVIPWTAAFQAPPSVRFSRRDHWSVLSFPSPDDLSDPGRFLTTAPSGKC